MKEKKIFIASFSCSGNTERLAKTLSVAAEADMYEIAPKERYTAQDLDWNNPRSRSSVEMNDPSARPKIGGAPVSIENYDVIFVGFPIWWYVAPRIIDTFLESYDFSDKIIVPFATSGGSGLGKTEENLRGSAPTAKWLPGKLLSSRLSENDAAAWIKSLELA